MNYNKFNENMGGGSIPSITYINNISSSAIFTYVDSNNEVQEIKGKGTFEVECKFIRIYFTGVCDIRFSAKNNSKAMFISGWSTVYSGHYIQGTETSVLYPDNQAYCLPHTNLQIEIIEHSGPVRPQIEGGKYGIHKNNGEGGVNFTYTNILYLF